MQLTSVDELDPANLQQQEDINAEPASAIATPSARLNHMERFEEFLTGFLTRASHPIGVSGIHPGFPF
jgi:hypothetical protein